ncbi:MAG: hypothetical protein BMS9Abin32_607 [Gammaproteobacteria bacterium]|nr:MAG: hypothetical protein BMS9Abin32_607 [Gammaproteobacteria bacterium]
MQTAMRSNISGAAMAGRAGHKRLPACVLAAAILTQAAWPDESGSHEAFFSDSSRERTPLVTEFPKYPYVARRDRIEGEATVCFTVNRRGQVVRPTIRRSTHRIFRRPALKAIRRSTFEPLQPGEEASKVKTCRIYRFKLEPIVADGT